MGIRTSKFIESMILVDFDEFAAKTQTVFGTHAPTFLPMLADGLPARRRLGAGRRPSDAGHHDAGGLFAVPPRTAS